MSNFTLVYVHDPMCSWCWGFESTWQDLLSLLPKHIKVNILLGGLAIDSNQPMSLAMQENLQLNWRNIEKKVPSKRFNFDFWDKCSPRRSTYPACRAVITAELLNTGFASKMTRAIQQAYYQQARNPSDNAVLIELAGELGLSITDFADTLPSARVQQLLEQQIQQAQALQVDSFPALVLLVAESRWRIPVDYLSAEPMLDMIEMLMD